MPIDKGQTENAVVVSFIDIPTAITYMLEIFRKSNHYSLRKLAPDLIQKLNNIPIEFINEALKIYQSKTINDKKAPHPNYFTATCLRLLKEGIKKRPPHIDKAVEIPPVVLGKLL